MRFSGTQKERQEAAAAAVKTEESPAAIAARFRAAVDLRAAKIVDVKRHPDAEKLYIETVDLGSEKRTIVSGLVPFYKEEELLGHTVVLVANLKPAVLRGVESQGMLLAAQAMEGEGGRSQGGRKPASEGKTVEVLFVDHAAPGSRVVLAGTEGPAPAQQIDIDAFFTMPIAAVDSRVMVGDASLECAGTPVVTTKVVKGRVK